MATKALTPAEAELVSSLTEDDIPTKLRCAICSKLAVNAYKLPCCEQLIDENCHATLPSTCPVCEHTPLSAADCKPNKVMRSTIRVFIKTELKKRETTRAKQTKEATPVASAAPVEVPAPGDFSQSSVTDGVAAIAVGETQGAGTLSFSSKTVDNAPSGVEDSQMQDNGHTNANQESVPPSHANGSDNITNTGTDDNIIGNTDNDNSNNADNNRSDANGNQEATAEGGAAEIQTAAESVQGKDGNAAMAEAQPEGEQPAAEGDMEENPVEDDSEAKADVIVGDDTAQGQDDATADANAPTSGVPGMAPAGPFTGLGSDVSQMQMMMAMQNGMMPNGFNFPMMAMPGMNMDPSMYMNGAFPGMGMNGPNLMNGGFGGAGNSGPWNGNQDSFNHPNASSMGAGDFGAYNSGFQGGYNQQFGYQNQFNNYRGFGRGRGRGRGFYNNGYGRGGYYNNGNSFGPGSNGFGPNGMNGPMNGNFPAHDQAYGSQQGGMENTNPGLPTHSTSGDIAVSNADSNMATDASAGTGADVPNGEDAGAAVEASADVGSATQDGAPIESSEDGARIPVLGSQELNHFPSNGGHPGGFGPQGQFGMGGPNMPFNPRGTNAVPLTATGPAPDVPLNAPSEPKAMRQGLPNTSLLHLRARGMITDSNGPGNFNGPANGSGRHSPAAEHGGHGRSRSNSVSTRRRDHERYRERSRDRSRDRGGRNSRRRHDRSDRNGNHGYKRDRSAEREHGREPNRDHGRQPEDVPATEEKRTGADQDLDYDRHDDWENGSQGGEHGNGERDRDGRPDGAEERGRSESRSSRGHKRAHSEESAAAGHDHPEEGGKGADGASSRRKHRSGRKRRRRGGDRQPEGGGGEVVRTRSMSPIDESRRASGHRSHRERDTDKKRDRDHRDNRDRDRDRGRSDDHHRRSRRDEDRDRDRDHREHRDRDDRRDRDKDKDRRDKDKDRDGRNRDRDRERERDRDRDHGRSSGRDKDRGGDRGSSGKAAADGPSGASGLGSSDPYAAERERRTRERVAAEAQKRAGISSLAGSKRGRDDFEDGPGGGSGGGGSGRRNRRRGRRGEGEPDRDGHR